VVKRKRDVILGHFCMNRVVLGSGSCDFDTSERERNDIKRYEVRNMGEVIECGNCRCGFL